MQLRQAAWVVAATALAASSHAAPSVPEGFSEYVAVLPPANTPVDGGSAAGMNEQDQVVGYAYRIGKWVSWAGFRWNMPTGKMHFAHDLPDGAGETRLAAINDRGLAVGMGMVKLADGSEAARALALETDGRRVALAHPGEPAEWSRAVAVNSAGVAIGHVSPNGWSGPDYAVRWNVGGSVERLDLPARVERINTRGDIAGTTDGGSAFLQEAGGAFHTFGLVNVYQLRDDGTVVGSADLAGTRRGALWSAAGGLEYLPHPAGRPNISCWAQSMNSSGQVVGSCSDGLDVERAVTWKRVNGDWVQADLRWLTRDRALWGYGAALHITEAGHILADGSGRGLPRSPMVLVPVLQAAAGKK